MIKHETAEAKSLIARNALALNAFDAELKVQALENEAKKRNQER